MPSGISGARHHAEHVDRHDAVEIGQIVVEESPVHGARDPGVVHHHVQAAEFLDGCGHQRPDLFGVGDVRPPEEGVGSQRRGQRLTLVGFDVGYDDPRALGRELLDYAATDARGPAGDDGYFARQIVDHTTS